MKQHTTSTVYLIHLLRPLGNPNNPRGMASHYLGFAEHDLAARLERHHAGNGSRIMAAVAKAGIPGCWRECGKAARVLTSGA